jgi:large subunit ribosomal protein L9
MQVILLERIEKLGQMGQAVSVKPGYARNYLLPKKKALRATKDNISYFETQKSQLEATNLKRKGEAEQVAKKMDNVMVTLIRQASEIGQLYGSVRGKDISDALDAAGYTLDKGQVKLQEPIKTLGIHAARVVLHPEVSIIVRVNIAQSEEEAVVQSEAITKEAATAA